MWFSNINPRCEHSDLNPFGYYDPAAFSFPDMVRDKAGKYIGWTSQRVRPDEMNMYGIKEEN